MAEQRDMSGSMSRNKEKEAGSNWPDYKGKVVVNGKKYWLSGWVKDGQDGKWISLSVTDPGKQTKRSEKPPQGNPMPPPADEDLDDLPF